MVDSFSIFAEMLISKIFDYYLKEKIFPKRETDGKLDVYRVKDFDDHIKAIEKDPQFESSTIRLLIAILKVSLGGETDVNYESTMHQVFFIAQSEKNKEIYIKVDDSANIDVGIFFKTDDGKKLLIPFEVKTGNKSYFKENTEEPEGHEAPKKNGWTFPKMKGSVPGILAHTENINLEIKVGDVFPTKYSLFGLKVKPDNIQLNNFEDKKDDIVNSLKNHQYLIKRDKNSIGFICRDTPTLPTNSVFQIISLKTLFSEFAEQYFKDRFDKEENIFANTLKHLSKNIEVCWENYKKKYFGSCLVKVNNSNIKKISKRIKSPNNLIKSYSDHIFKFFTLSRKISDLYNEFSVLNDIEKLKAHIPENELKIAQSEWNDFIDIQKCFNGVFELREKRIEAEFNNYVHHFLNTIDTDFYNEWVKK